MLRRPRIKGVGSIKRQKGRTCYNVRSNQKWLKWETDSKVEGIGGIVAGEAGEIRAAQIHAMENVIKKELKSSDNQSKHILRIYPHTPRTQKGKETGLGMGKGAIEWWGTKVRKGQILVEFRCIDKEKAKKIEEWVRSKMPIKTELIYRKVIKPENS